MKTEKQTKKGDQRKTANGLCIALSPQFLSFSHTYSLSSDAMRSDTLFFLHSLFTPSHSLSSRRKKPSHAPLSSLFCSPIIRQMIAWRRSAGTMRIRGPRGSGRRRVKTAAHSAWPCCVHRYVCKSPIVSPPLCYWARREHPRVALTFG